MHVTLIRPPAYSVGLMGVQLVPFLGIAYIGAAIRRAGYSVDIIDMCGEDIDRTQIIRGKYVQYGMPFSALKKRLKHSEVIGFTCSFSQDWPFQRELIQYVAEISPHSVLIAGGEHVTAMPEYCLDNCAELNMCVEGEGEEVIVQLLDALSKKGDLAVVPSLVYRSSERREYCHTQRASRIKDIDKLPLPAWDLIPLENYLSRGLNYHIRRGRTIPILATRGCPYKCTFCSNTKMWGNPWVVRDPRLVVDEMEQYIHRYKADNFVFSDLTAVVSTKGIIKFCQEIIARKLNITWQLPTLRTEALDYDLLHLMYQAGCRDLDYAIESGSNEVLASVHKKNDPIQIAALIKDSLKVGMNLSVNIVLGLPREGLRDYFRTYWMMMRLALRGLQELNVFPFIPYPGSELFHEFLEDKRIKLSDAYFLNLFGYADLSKPISWSRHFGPKTLSSMRFFLLVSFYSVMLISHPSRIIKMFVNAAKGRTTTKLEGVMKRVFKNIKATIFCKQKYAR